MYFKMRVGAFVKLIDGPYKGRYGKVVSMNGDLGRVTLQWALGIYGKGAEVNEIFTELVTSAEYEKRGKDITKQTANGHTEEPQDDPKYEKSKKREKSKEKKAKKDRKKEKRAKSLKYVKLEFILVFIHIYFSYIFMYITLVKT